MSVQESVERAQAAHVAVARQPILDRDEAVAGYELLYRSSDAAPAALDHDGATSKVIVHALADIGLEQLVGETRAEYDACRALGFDAFQGYFFAQPILVEGDAVPTHRLGGLAALAQAGEATSFESLERLISQDAGLAYKLVRLANSAFIAARGRITSVHGALTLMGSVNVRRWAMLLLLADLTDRPQHLLATAVVRARQCELLATEPAEPAAAFTTGLFSILDALVGAPMPALLDGLPFDARITHALLHHAGPEGALLASVLAYERGDFDAVADLPALATTYRDALAWVEQAAPHLA